MRSPLNSPTTFWYVGKVAFGPDDSSDGTSSDGAVSACLSQKRVILEYSRQQLRPQNMDGKYAAALELWLAPGDSEMDVVQNKVSLQLVRGSAADLPDDFTVETVGYNPEVYVGDEVTKGGLRVELSEEGHPVPTSLRGQSVGVASQNLAERLVIFQNYCGSYFHFILLHTHSSKLTLNGKRKYSLPSKFRMSGSLPYALTSSFSGTLTCSNNFCW